MNEMMMVKSREISGVKTAILQFNYSWDKSLPSLKFFFPSREVELGKASFLLFLSHLFLLVLRRTRPAHHLKESSSPLAGLICSFLFFFSRVQQQQKQQTATTRTTAVAVKQDSHCTWRPANFPTSVPAALGFFRKLSSSTTFFQLESLRSVSGSSRNQGWSEVGHSWF